MNLAATACRLLCALGLVVVPSAACSSRGAESPSLAPPLKCENSYLDKVDGKETGFATCSNGMLHRPKAVTCPNSLPRTDGHAPSLKSNVPWLYELPPEERGSMCLSDSDCTERPYGHCEPWLPPGTGTSCSYGCVSDSECDADELCLCREPVGRCVRASCRSDAACKPPFVCGEYMVLGGVCGRGGAFACQTERDECAGQCKGYCSIEQGHRTCTYDCGTP